MWRTWRLVVLIAIMMLLPAGCEEKKPPLSECGEAGLTVSVAFPQATVVEVAVKAEGIDPLTEAPVIVFVVPEAAKGLEGVWRFNGLVEGGPAINRKSERWQTVMDAITARCGGSVADWAPAKAWTFMVESKPGDGNYTVTLDLYGIPEHNWGACTAWVVANRAECYGLTSISLGRPGR